ncbi:MAG TPA: rRNA maturation RNase YbeY [Pseudomonadales bacterium]|nr:rRNA maturation RNase YbeY [Pseudomonadales bacterium]
MRQPGHISVDCASSAAAIPAARSIRTWVRAALDSDHTDAEICVRIVDEAEMRDLNARYRSRDCTTNVLSFPAELPPAVDVPLLGDIVVCAPVVAREAAEQHKPARAHWAHMLVHATLHLLGHDHERAREAARMEALETRILATLKFPDPYRM